MLRFYGDKWHKFGRGGESSRANRRRARTVRANAVIAPSTSYHCESSRRAAHGDFRHRQIRPVPTSMLIFSLSGIAATFSAGYLNSDIGAVSGADRNRFREQWVSQIGCEVVIIRCECIGEEHQGVLPSIK